MSILSALQAGVRAANKITKSGKIQADVTYEKCTAVDGAGKKTYASAVTLGAIVEWKQERVETRAGVWETSKSTVMFLDVAALKLATKGDPIKKVDRITLPDGTTGGILTIDGFMDSETKRAVAPTVRIG